MNVEWDTGRRALAAYDPAADWHLVLQDDAVICDDLVAGLARALDRVAIPSIVSLYLGTVRPFASRVEHAAQVAEEIGASWVTAPGLYWGVALAVPVPLVEDLLHRADTSRVAEYDSRLSRAAMSLDLPVWYTRPSLVDHRQGPSLLLHPGGARHSHGFLGEDVSALDVDWNYDTVDLVGVPRAAAPITFPRRVGSGRAPVPPTPRL